MKIPLSWLKDFVDINLPVEQLAERMTLAGLEVESIERIGELWDRDKIFVGQILDVVRHPDAERLTLVRVDYGAGEPMTVVTGAPNMIPYIGQDLSRRQGAEGRVCHVRCSADRRPQRGAPDRQAEAEQDPRRRV